MNKRDVIVCVRTGKVAGISKSGNYLVLVVNKPGRTKPSSKTPKAIIKKR